MKLTIITVNLNNYSGLKKTIESVISQSFKDYEWIIIDGGSTDGSCDLINQYSKKLSYWVSEQDRGIYNAMNKGILVANGEYLLFLNSGDELYSDDVLESVFSMPHMEDILFGDVALSRNNIIVDTRHYDKNLSLKYLIQYSIAHCCVFIRRNLHKKYLYDESYRITADRKFFISAALMGYSFGHIPIMVSKYDLSGVSSTNVNQLQLEEKRILNEVVPSPVLCDIERLSYFDGLGLRHDDILTIKMRHQYPIFRKFTTFAIKLMRKTK